MNFELNYTLEELEKRTSEECFTEIKLLDLESPEYLSLSEEDKLCLKHLCKASQYIDKIHFKMENELNEDFLKFLNTEIEKGDKRALLTKKLFLAQKSMFSPDIDGNEVVLCKNVKKPFGFGYPRDLSVKEFHKILNEMLDKEKYDEVQSILTQRSIVKRKGKELIGVDYIDEYKEEFLSTAEELKKASEYTTDKNFKQYLSLQVDALMVANAKLDALADKKWAELSDTTLEFTITRETYNDRMTESIFSNESLLNKIEKAGIEINTKDNLGVRVGIVNKQGTKLLHDLSKLVDIAGEYMPYKDEYDTKTEDDETGISQTAVDVDVVCLNGEEGAFQAGIVLAQNLPNNDKLSLRIGGGRRNVYHRQIRNSNLNQKLIDAKISPDFVKYYNQEASHWGTICHENTHSLGPDGNKALGAYSSILEEFKADMGMYCFLDIFVEKGLFTEVQAKQIMVTELSSCFPKGKPVIEQAHRVRSVMIAKRMMLEGALLFDSEGRLEFNFEKVISTSKKMMEEVIRLQLDKNVKNAENYVNKYFDYDSNFEKMAELQKKFSKRLNSYLTMPIYEKAIKE